jgi:hypothetical protein
MKSFLPMLVAFAVVAGAFGQDVNLPPQSAGLRALLASHESLQQYSLFVWISCAANVA